MTAGSQSRAAGSTRLRPRPDPAAKNADTRASPGEQPGGAGATAGNKVPGPNAG